VDDVAGLPIGEGGGDSEDSSEQHSRERGGIVD